MRIAIYFPSKSEQKIPKARFESVRKDIERKLIEMFGGLTEYKAKGFWMNFEGDSVEEEVRILEAYTETLSVEQLLPTIRKIRDLLKQDSVAYAIDNTIHFYEGEERIETVREELAPLAPRREPRTRVMLPKLGEAFLVGTDEGDHYIISSTIEKVR